MLRLLYEVPSAGRVWKISIMLLMNIAIIVSLFALHTLSSSTWFHFNLVILAVIACLDFVILKRFIFPSPSSGYGAKYRSQS
jgi:hypothetical protein